MPTASKTRNTTSTVNITPFSFGRYPYSVTINSASGQEYVISKYWIRGYNKEIAVLDTSIRYLHHYQIKATTTTSS